MDFGENYSCFFQDEAQGAHWARQQVTIHPIVAFYHCPIDNEIVEDTYVFISEDIKHDSHAAHHFEMATVQEILKQGVKLNKIIHFTDGCSSQYKGKTSFVDVSFAESDTGVPTEKHFFGSRHGKGPCDRQIGVVKKMAKRAVLNRKEIIKSAEDLYLFGKETLSLPKEGVHSHKKDPSSLYL